MTNPLWDGLFARHVGSDAPFLLLADGRRVTYGAFLGLAARYAHLFTEHGLRPRDRLAVQAEMTPEALAIYAACVQTGIAYLPLDTACTPSEVDYFVSDSGAALLVGDPAAGALPDVARRYGARYLTLAADGTGTLTDLSAGPSSYPTVPRVGIDLAVLLYTSGTTGRAKGVMLTHDNLLSNAMTLAGLWQFTAGDVLLHALSAFQTQGFFAAINVTLASGGSMILVPERDAAATIAHLPGATAMTGIPPFYYRLLADERFDAGLCAGIRLAVTGSAPLSEAAHARLEARTGHRVLECYGMAEAGIICSDPGGAERRTGTVGPPLSGISARIVADGTEVSRGGIGVLQVKGPNVFQSYWGKPRMTRAELAPDGWFNTGDLARMDEDGRVSILGRTRDLIVSDGRTIVPAEVERILDEIPGVIQSCVIGAPHPDRGEAVVALLVADGDGLDLSAAETALADQLATHESAALVEVIDELPRNAAGNVLSSVLRERCAGRFGET